MPSYTGEPKAEYEGDAVGRYAQRDGDIRIGPGRFTATVNPAPALRAAADAGRLSGAIPDFGVDWRGDPREPGAPVAGNALLQTPP